MTSLLDRRKTHFVLWRPEPVAAAARPPALVIGQFDSATPALLLVNERCLSRGLPCRAPMTWEIPAADCGLTEGTVYHYWFEVTNANVYPGATNGRLE